MSLPRIDCFELLDALLVGVFVTGADGDCLYANRRCLEMLGVSKDDLMGMKWLESVHPEDRGWVSDTWRRCTQESLPYNVENRYVRPDGSVLWAAVKVSRVACPDGGEACLGVLEDITKQRTFQTSLLEKEERLQFALSSARLGLIDWTFSTNELYINEEWSKILGVSIPSILREGAIWRERIHPDDFPGVLAKMELHKTGRLDEYQIDYRIQREDGEWRWINSSGRVWMRDEDGRPLRSISIHKDTTDQRRIESEKARQSYFIERIARFTPDLVCIYDLDSGLTVYINEDVGENQPHFAEMARASAENKFSQLMHPEDRSAMELHSLRLAGLADGATREIEYRVILSTGDERWLRSRDSVFERNEDGSAKQILSIVQDITLQRRNQELFEAYAVQAHEARAKLELLKIELEKANGKLAASNEELSRLSTTDPLTGLLNRRYFEEGFNELIENTTAEERCLSLVMLDVDHFKKLNDTYGHQEGDEVLRTVARLIRENVPLDCPCVRYGGEEFLIVLESYGPTRASEIAEKIRVALEVHPWSPKKITASFGVSSRSAGIGADELIDQADQALYAAKEGGRNRTCHFREIGEAQAA